MEDLIHVRRATLEDKQAVLNINTNVYDGLDYLEALYEEDFIGSPNTTSYVAVLGGEIVGFSAVSIVDDEQTAMSRAGRVSQKISSRAIYKLVKNHALSQSNATIDAFTIFDSNQFVRSRSFLQQNRLIATRIYFRFDLKQGEMLLQSDVEIGISKLGILTQAHLQEYFMMEAYRNYLFPKERMIVKLLPFRLLLSNIPLLWKRSEHSHRITDIRINNGKVKGIVSILSTYIGGSGALVCHLDVYGSDNVSLKLHLKSHFDFIDKHKDIDKSLLIVADLDQGREWIEETCAEFRLLNSDEKSIYSSPLHLFEKRMSCTKSLNTL